MENRSQDDNQGCLLNYFTSTAPTPVQTGAGLRLDTSVSTPAGSTVYCNKIVLAFPVDATDPAALFAAAPVSSLNTSAWAVTASTQTGEELGMGVSDTQYTTFIYTCSSPSAYQIDYNLVFGAMGQVSPAPGSTQVLIKETSGTTSDPGSFTDRIGGVAIDKSPPQLFLTNFVATAPNAPTVPLSDFANAAPIYFEWESNGTYFQIFANGQSAPIYAGTQPNFTLSGGIARDTTFVLAAAMTGDPKGDSPSSGYLPVYQYEALTVTVSNPDLTPKSVNAGALNVSGNTALAGTLGVTGVTGLASATVGGTLAVAGALTGTGGANVTGGLTGDNANVTGNLNVNGTTSLGVALMNVATVSGAFTANGGANVSGFRATGGSVAMFGSGTMLASGTSIPNTQVLARTDGFAVVQILFPESNSASSYAYGQVYTAGQWFQQQGGNVGQFGSSWCDQMNNNPTTMTIPIPAGSYWQYFGSPSGGGNQEDSPIQIWWFPLGNISGEESFQIVTDGSGPEIVEPRRIVSTDSSGNVRENAEIFITRLAEAFNVSLGVKERDELTDLLARRG